MTKPAWWDSMSPADRSSYWYRRSVLEFLSPGQKAAVQRLVDAANLPDELEPCEGIEIVETGHGVIEWRRGKFCIGGHPSNYPNLRDRLPVHWHVFVSPDGQVVVSAMARPSFPGTNIHNVMGPDRWDLVREIGKVELHQVIPDNVLRLVVGEEDMTKYRVLGTAEEAQVALHLLAESIGATLPPPEEAE